MKKKAIIKFLLSSLVFLAAVAYVIKFGTPQLLRMYVETGMGNCQNQPIFCTIPQGEINNPDIDADYIKGLTRYMLPEIEIDVPKNFTVVKQSITKVYYKKRRQLDKKPTIYLLYQKPGFFINLFPQLQRQGVEDDYTFMQMTLNAKTKDIKNITDAFFSITKSIFTPNLGDQKNLKIVRFVVKNKRGFITYNLMPKENYFDCNLFDTDKNYFKLYIKDIGATLDLEKVIAIISTIKKGDIPAISDKLPGLEQSVKIK